MAEEIIYIGSYDNTIDLLLNSDGVPIPLSTVTRIDANISGIDVTSTNQGSDLIRWDQAGYVEGEARCKFGGVTGLAEGYAQLWLTLYEPTNPNGVVFGPIHIEIHELP